MKKKLKFEKPLLINADEISIGDRCHIWGDAKNLSGNARRLHGNVSSLRGVLDNIWGHISDGLRGEVTFLFGDITGYSGDVDECELMQLTDVEDLVERKNEKEKGEE